MSEDLLLLENEDFESVSGNSAEVPPNGDGHEEGGAEGGDPVEESGIDSEVPSDGGASADPVEGDGGSSGDVSDGLETEVLAALESVSERLDNSPDFDGLVDSLHSLVDIMSVQAFSSNVETSVTIPIKGYKDWDYGITVNFAVFPYGAGYWMYSSENCSNAEDFESWYANMCSLIGDTLNDFHITTVVDDNGTEVYDYETYVDSGMEEEPVEEDTFKEDMLLSLALLHEDLQTISMNDLEYRGETLQLQQQYLDFEKESRELHYQMLASNIAIGFAVLLTLGYTVAHGFFQRMKVG